MTPVFRFDRYGNLVGFAQNISGITDAPNPTVDENTNRFTSGQGFAYDKNGNIITDTDPNSSLTRSFVFNGDNKQIVVKDVNGNPIGKYFYDGEGKRVKKVTDNETTVFVYSSGKLIAEYSTATPPATPSINYTTTDHLGTPRIITDQYGQVKARRDFMPFGEDLFINVGARSTSLNYGTSQDDIRQKFTGYQKDKETGLDFAEARMYENHFGRFTAVDPLLASGKSANPQSFNRYIYVGNNPVIITDPSGLDWFRQKAGDRWIYQDFDDSPGDGWEAVDFGGYSNIYQRIDNICITSECNSTRYLNRYGGSLTPEEYAEMEQSRSFSGRLGLTFTGMAKSGGNNFIGISNSFYQGLELVTTIPMPRTGLFEPSNDFEAQQMFSTDLALLGVSVYSGGLTSSRSVQTFAGFTGKSTLSSGKGAALMETGGLNLHSFESSQATLSTNWRTGDYFLYLKNQGSVKANWAQNSGALRREMNMVRPIFDSYRTGGGQLIPARSGSFLNAERNLLMDRGWIYNAQRGSWLPPSK